MRKFKHFYEYDHNKVNDIIKLMIIKLLLILIKNLINI